MKRFFSLLVLVGMLYAGATEASACVCKSASTAPYELTLIVMDTSQALLPEAEVRIGKQRLTTAFDGRVVLPEVKPDTRVVVRCEGYKQQTIRTSGEGWQCVCLVPEKPK